MEHDILLGNECLDVAANLHAALRRLRLAEVTRWLWVDALCINQLDEDEKARQINIMGLIFSRAFRVIVWLGEEADGSSMMFDNSLRSKSRSSYNGAVADSYHKISKWPWFMRTWVIQEFALNEKIIVQCGVRSCAWKDFMSTQHTNPSSC